MPAPTHTSSAGVHILDWPEYHIRIRIDRLRSERENLTGEITVKTTNPGVAQHLHQARFNLTSTTARKTLAKVLEERITLAWDDMIEQACVMVLTKHREGEPVIRVGNLPPREALKYRVAPILLNNQPTLLYGPGGVGKSYFALYLAVLIGGAWIHNNLVTEPGKVLMLDYETDQYEVDERIKTIVNGLGVETKPEIYYRFCTGPLSHEVEDIQAFVTENQIDVVVVDPLGGAVGADMNDSEPILDYFRALRSIRTITGLSVTSLSIDHTNKEGRLFGCYSSDTEVLTKRGWVLHTDLQEGEEVAAFDPRALALHWELPSRFWDYEYAGDMIEICHESTNALVTPNHRMVVKARVGDEGYASHWDMVEAERLLANRWTVVSHAPLKRKGSRGGGRSKQTFSLGKGCSSLPMDDWLRFLSYYLSEGGTNHNSILLTQCEGPVLDKMRTTLDHLGFSYTDKLKPRPKEYLQWKPCHTLIVHVAAGARHQRAKRGIQRPLKTCLHEQCGASLYEKHLPSFVFGLRPFQQEMILDALIEGDGSLGANGIRFYHTASERLGSDIQALATLLGYPTNMISRHRTLRPQYQLTIGRRERRRLMISADSGTIRQVPYSGHVYCLSVPSGSYVTRRLGKVAFHGNSEYKFHRARSVFEAKKQQDTGADFLDFGLYNRKMNPGKLLPPRGYRLTFGVDSVVFTEKDVRDVPELAGVLPLKDQIYGLLRSGKLSVQDISETLNAKEDSVRVVLNRNTQLFVKVGSAWGIIAGQERA